MENNQIRINIQDIRAIKSADIILNGITVVAGENGCGKSTLSKLLYHTFKISKDYDLIIARKLNNQLRQILDSLSRVVYDLLYLIEDKELKEDIEQMLNIQLIDTFRQSDENFTTILVNIKKVILESLYKFDQNKPVNTLKYKLANIGKKVDINHEFRIKQILLELLYDDSSDDKDINQLFDELIIKVKAMYSDSRNQIQSRSIDILDFQISRAFGNDNFNSNYNLYEYGVCITDRDTNRLLSMHSVNQTVYIDTPMSMGLHITLRNSNFSHWNDLNVILKNEIYDNTDNGNNIENIIKNQILYGDTSYVKDSILQESFIYRRDDGSIFNLLDCATGIKSFSILQMLLKKGYLDNKTLLIIDEPEVHLHPQWIIEYARLLVLLNKELGVKFFIASHNPDMVSAIRYISEKEGTLKKLNYYLAQKSEIRHQYNYKHLGIEIDEIFASFNIAIDRINQYGSVE